MSLTSFVDLPDVKQQLREIVPKPWFQLRAGIKAPPLTSAHGLTGTAFDYLLRFYVEKLNPSARKTRWVAEQSLAILQLSCAKQARGAREIVDTAKREYARYLRAKGCAKPCETLICAAIDLAQLDLVYRIGVYDVHPISNEIVTDLQALLALVPADMFRSKKICVLNPTFGTASRLVGGADADLFIDGTLIEIKTSKHLALEREVFNQLVGYYCLSCIGGVDGCKSKVTHLAVYYARYGLLHQLSMESFVISKRFLEWSVMRAKQEFGDCS